MAVERMGKDDIQDLSREFKLKIEEVFLDFFPCKAEIDVEIFLEPFKKEKLNLAGQQVIYWADFFQNKKGFSFLSLAEKENSILAGAIAHREKLDQKRKDFEFFAVGEIFNIVSSSCLAVLADKYNIDLRLNPFEAASAQKIRKAAICAEKEMKEGIFITTSITVFLQKEEIKMVLSIIFDNSEKIN